MSASPVSSPDTLSAERVAAIRAECVRWQKAMIDPTRDDTTIALCDSHERLRALLSERPTLSQADALIDAYTKARDDWTLRRPWADRDLEITRATLRAALLREKP